MMANEIISYLDMCQREGASLQRGMNFRLGGNHSVILMSLRENAPYADRLENDGETLIYEGHDVPKTNQNPEPKRVDQPERTPSGSLTENGKFYQAAQAFKEHGESPERVRVYEKLKKGIWSYNGVFHLVDSWMEPAEHRQVFKFKLVAVEGDEDFTRPVRRDIPHRRVIPTWVKVEVWKRDGGRCVECGATDELHFDHDLPYAKGGTSITPANVQLLCARHNLEKRDRIR
jgi:hypothetical protein